MSSTSFDLRGCSRPGPVSRDHVYFAFASGRLRYDCASCDALCCRGHGFSVRVGDELQRLLFARPAVRFFLQPRKGPGDDYFVNNLKPGCFLLKPNGHCQVHVDHGYQAKFEACRLFPFNQFAFADGYLIVAPHRGLCPLKTVAPGEHDRNSDHGQLFDEFAREGISVSVPDATLPAGYSIDDIVALERRIVDLSESAVPGRRYERFVEDQIATARTLSPAALNADVASEDADEPSAVLQRVLAHQLDTAPAAALDDRVVSMTPVLRAFFIFHEADPAHPERVPLEQVPHALLALHVLCRLAEQAGMADLSYQSIMQILIANRRLIWLLSLAATPVTWKPVAPVEKPTTNATDYARSYRLLIDQLLGPSSRRRVPLGYALANALTGLPPIERITFLRFFAKQLSDRIVPAHQSNSSGLGTHVRRFARRVIDGHRRRVALSQLST